jgi:hypothetical protein
MGAVVVTPVTLWAVAAVLVVAGEVWALVTRAEGDTITETFKRHWWSRGAMTALIVWAAWHFLTDTGGWVDLIFVVFGFVLGAVADRLKLRPGGKP